MKLGRPFSKSNLSKNTWVQSLLIVVGLTLLIRLTNSLPIFWIVAINLVQAALVFCAMVYFYIKGAHPVRKVVFPIGVLSLVYTLIFTSRLIFEQGERLEGEWAKIGTVVATYVWFPVWFWAAYSYFKSAKEIRKHLKQEIAEVRSLLKDGPQ